MNSGRARCDHRFAGRRSSASNQGAGSSGGEASLAGAELYGGSGSGKAGRRDEGGELGEELWTASRAKGARFIVRKASDLTAVPDELDPAAATSIVLSYMTAYQMMFRFAEVKSGDAILLHGLGGAVGDAALQLAKQRGLVVYGTARPQHFERIEAQGGRAVDYRGDWVAALRQLVGPRGFDAVFDPVGEAGFRKSRSLVAEGGILVPFGMAGYTDKPRWRTAFTFVKLMLLAMAPGAKRSRFYRIAHLRRHHQD